MFGIKGSSNLDKLRTGKHVYYAITRTVSMCTCHIPRVHSTITRYELTTTDWAYHFYIAFAISNSTKKYNAQICKKMALNNVSFEGSHVL